MSDPSADIVPDSQHRGLVAALPERLRNYALLARFDRPIGWWLLFWPCAWGVLLAGGEGRLGLIAWLLLGSIAMRGAGCVYNDIVDADLDRRVARTAARPVASGAVSKRAAWAWLLVLCLIGLVVLLQLRWQAQLAALASLAPVAAYPFMKRITWWPQAWLGLVFSWGALVGWAELRLDHVEVLAALYAGSICWVIGYDTIYALQDREDDALVGVRSTARLFGGGTKPYLAGFYAGATVLFAAAFFAAGAGVAAYAGLAVGALHLGWQVRTLNTGDPGNCLRLFRSNRDYGWILFAGLLLDCWLTAVN